MLGPDEPIEVVMPPRSGGGTSIGSMGNSRAKGQRLLLNCGTIFVCPPAFKCSAPRSSSGTTGTAQALAHTGSPLAIGSGRIVVGGIALAFVARSRGELVHFRPVTGLVCLSAAGVAVYQLAFFAAVKSTGVAVGTVVAIGAGAVLTGVLERVFERQTAGRRWAVATGLAVSGLTLLALGSQSGGGARPAGIALALVAALAYATYAVVSKRLLRLGYAPAGVMGSAFGLAAVLLIPVLVLTGGPWLATSRGIAVILYLALLPTTAAYLLYAYGLKRITAAETTTIGLAEPLTAAVLGVVVLHESLRAAPLAGSLLILVGLFVLASPLPRARRSAPSQS
jgi:drug/metabolite transporter, DME family